MNIGNLLSQIGIEQQAADRFTEYHGAPAAAHDHLLHYAYEVPHPTAAHITVSKHTHHDDHKHSAALSALTLLAFLFFLNILQQCLKDHMTSMNPPQVMIMGAGREEEGSLHKMSDINKLDKSGVVKTNLEDQNFNTERDQSVTTKGPVKRIEEKPSTTGDEEEKSFMKIKITEHIPNRIRPNKILRKNDGGTRNNVFLNYMDVMN